MARTDDDQLCHDWNPACSAEVEDRVITPRDVTQAWSSLASIGSSNPVRQAAQPHLPEASSRNDLAAPMAAFTIHDLKNPITFDPDATIGVFEGVCPNSPEQGPSREPPPVPGSRGAEAIVFPEPGDGIAGYRLISELGRGAFGRVFLAEESLLGNRLVALKISKAEGDEPRILARLQHTHIVPIHSVHDDPKTGLRVMCMPYVGGANLAQVLEAAAAVRGADGAGRSLLRALDIVALPPPSEAACNPNGSRRRRSTSPSAHASGSKPNRRESTPAKAAAVSSHDAPVPTDSVVELVEPRPAGSASVLKWPLLHQIPWWSRTIAQAHQSWPLTRHDEPSGSDRDPVQPARRFMREATFVRSAVWIIARLAEGLEHAHSHGLMHRDLKPSNILIAADGTPMLLDFNLAADSQAKANENDRVRMGGTLPYMSPEHLDAFHPHGTTPPEGVDERSDIYALGLILFEMIAGQRPFPEPEPQRPILESIRILIDDRQAGAPSLRSCNPGVPRDLDAVIRKCLHPDPDRRHTRAGDLAEDLRRVLDDQPLKYTPEPTVWGRVAKWVRRNPRATGASTVGAVGLTLLIAVSGVALSVSSHLKQASAHLRLNGFESRFPECQFLLNTVGGPAESLGKGITLADEILSQAGVSFQPGAPVVVASWLDDLPDQDRSEVRRNLAELILLVARARIYLADQTRSVSQKRDATLQAITWLNRAEAIDPNPTMTLYDDRASYLAQVGETQRAAADRHRRDAVLPSTGRDFYLLGTALLARGEPDRAETALIKATGLSPQGFWPWFALGLCHYDQKRYADSAGDFAVCSVLSPRFAWPWMNRGLALTQLGRLVEARAAYDRAVTTDGLMVDALANRGLVALELNDADAAVADLEHAIKLGRRDVNIQAALGEALGRVGRSAEAIRLLDDLITMHPEAILPRVARGTLRVQTDPAGAEGDFRQILKVTPRHSGALLGMARLRRLSDPHESLRYATLALECDPNRIDIIELRAWLHGSFGDRHVLSDVDRLVQNPTANRLYNAACSLALYVRRCPDSNLTDRAISYLRRATQLGVPLAQVRTDPDFASLWSYQPFQELIATPARARTEPGAERLPDQ